MRKVVVVVAAVIVTGGGLYLWSEKKLRDDCKKEALVASVEAYPMNEYTDVAERTRLQGVFEQKYIESCH